MVNDTIQELKAGIEKAHENLKKHLSRLRTGRANAGLLDAVRVDYYGSPTPIQQVAAVTVPEPRLLVVKPWDKTQIKMIEKAIVEADLGLNPQNDGEIIRLPMPALTEERRKELVKVAKKHGEESKVAIRKARHDCKDMIDSLKEEGDISEDEQERALKQVEDIVQHAVTQVDEIVSRKEKDIVEI